MTRFCRKPALLGMILILLIGACAAIRSQSTDSAALIHRIDAAVHNRNAHVLEFTDVEHYSVYRGQDQTHAAAAMTVKVTYRKGVGKSYEVLSRSGSGIIQKFGLQPLIDNEKEINDPAKVQNSWFTSANYDMQASAQTKRMDDNRTCTAVAIHPRHKAPNMIDGTLWVDGSDGEICEVDGIASQKPSIFAGTTHMTRFYRMIDGYAMATHARAESDSKLFGKTVVTIEYGDYHLQSH
ncbi:MAG: hypothetical protein ACLGSD_19520 [Acidobacteriota bacterium]